MAQTKEIVKVFAEELRHGTSYSGNIAIKDKVFTYSLTLPEGLFARQEPKLDRFLESCQLEVKVDSKPTGLSKEEKGMFMFLTVKTAGDLFNHTQANRLAIVTEADIRLIHNLRSGSFYENCQQAFTMNTEVGPIIEGLLRRA
jgi:hypothetical protein